MNLIFAGVATTLLVVRALSRKSLTLSGILAAILTAAVHALHPWNLPFILLITFYALGTIATKVKHDVKAKLTLSSSGATGGEGARNHVQVLANSVVASILILLHAKQLHVFTPSGIDRSKSFCFHNSSNDLIIIGIIANYAATLSDTLSSELGILSQTPPRLITTLNVTPRGTNGGVTLYGLTAGAAGAAIIGAISVFFLPACETTSSPWGWGDKVWFVAFITFIGVSGSLLDSLLGALFQQSVVDIRSNKIVEAPNGAKVLVEPKSSRLTTHGRLHSKLGAAPQSAAEAIAEQPDGMTRYRGTTVPVMAPERPNSRKVITAVKLGVLSNNQVNLLMAFAISVVAMIMWGGMGKVGTVVGEQLRTAVKAVIKQELISATVKAVLGV